MVSTVEHRVWGLLIKTATFYPEDRTHTLPQSCYASRQLRIMVSINIRLEMNSLQHQETGRVNQPVKDLYHTVHPCGHGTVIGFLTKDKVSEGPACPRYFSNPRDLCCRDVGRHHGQSDPMCHSHVDAHKRCSNDHS